MDEVSPGDAIESLEARIEALSESIERSRKIDLAAKLVIAAGGVWLVAMLAGLTSFVTAGFLVSAAAVIGGIVLFGSNASTLREAEAERQKAEAQRAELIEQLELRLVAEPRRLH